MKPFIHLFRTPKNHYFFDVNRNENIRIEKETYEYLEKTLKDEIIEENVNKKIEQELKMLKQDGYLSEKRIKEIKHPGTDLLETYLNRKMKMLIIQLTQNCNLRCEYCPYTFNDGIDRVHKNITIDFETIKKALLIFRENSIDNDEVLISFYGGEPLMEFNLIKETVNYCKDIFQGKSISFSLTTNGTLFTQEVMFFFEEENFSLLLSLDGPKDSNDKNRKFVNNDKSVFDKVMSNLKIIEKEYPKLFKNISINMVIDPTVDFENYVFLFREYQILDDISIRVSILEDYTTDNRFKSTEAFNKSYRELERKYFTYVFNNDEIVDKKFTEAMFSAKYQELLSDLDKSNGLGDIGCPSGPCIPGIQRLMVDVKGKFYPCERISESNEFNIIGDVENGIIIDKVKKILNIAQYNKVQCKTCFAFRECGFCVKNYQKQTDEIEVSNDECEKNRVNFHYKLIDMQIIKENKYDKRYEG